MIINALPCFVSPGPLLTTIAMVLLRDRRRHDGCGGGGGGGGGGGRTTTTSFHLSSELLVRALSLPATNSPGFLLFGAGFLSAAALAASAL